MGLGNSPPIRRVKESNDGAVAEVFGSDSDSESEWVDDDDESREFALRCDDTDAGGDSHRTSLAQSSSVYVKRRISVCVLLLRSLIVLKEGR